MNLEPLSTPRIIFLSCLVVFGISLVLLNKSTYIHQKIKQLFHQSDSTDSNDATTFLDIGTIRQLLKQGDNELNDGDINKAMTCYRQALTQYPSIADILVRLGKAYTKKGRPDLALCEFKAALSINPGHIEAYLLLARGLRDQKKFDDALMIYNHVLKLKPDLYSTYIEIAKIYMDNKQFDQALKFIEKAEKLMPNNVHVYLTRGHILNWKGDIVGAIDWYKQATILDPKCANAHYNLGHTLKVYRKFTEAIESLNKAAKLDPSHVDTHIALSHAYWALGNFDEAWKEYEWRWKQYSKDPRNKNVPEWQGQNVRGKKILLFSEQGLGDTLQFIRFAQDLKLRGAQVWCKVQKPLIKLLSHCPYIDHLVTDDSKLLDIDYQTGLMSMPGKLHLTPQTIPAQKQYLYADKKLAEQWQKKLGNDKKLKIGLCWHVDEKHEIYKLPIQRRSFPIKEFIPLANNKVSLYCLQLVDDKVRAEIPQKLNLHTFGNDFDKVHGSFMDSAAVITNLDLIITADTAIAHLAGGLGKTVWMVLPYSSDCRWYLKSDSSPWYPAMKIFRQPEPGNWKMVMNAITDSIKKFSNA